MRKHRAIALFGEGHAPTATAVGISTQAVSDWPDPLTPRIADRVIAAAWRHGIAIPDDIESDADPIPEQQGADLPGPVTAPPAEAAGQRAA